MAGLAIEEAARIGILKVEDVGNSQGVHASEAYFGYVGSFSRIEVIRRYTDSFES